jgi:RimJ/RimL family protein N-acetyltransferase
MTSNQKVKVHTAIPFPIDPEVSRDEIYTARLILRPPRSSDLEAFYRLRTDPGAMEYTSEGHIDRSLEESRSKMEAWLPPRNISSHFYFIFNKETGDLIGAGGVHRTSHLSGWPEVGYLFKQEAWGKGYATEFLSGFLDNWWKLPRKKAYIEVDEKSVIIDSEGKAVEQLSAIVEAFHIRSKNVLEKCKLQVFQEWVEIDHREGYHSRQVLMAGYGISPPSDSVTAS